MIKEIKGDLLKTNCKIIAHGVNCQGRMGSGVAKALYTKWPEVKKEYLKMCSQPQYSVYKEALLGSTQAVYVSNKIVVNCFTQQNYGRDGQVYLNYNALTECMSSLHDLMELLNIDEVAMPRIGCGLAGGDWKEVKKILDDIFWRGKFDKVKVYYI